MPRHKPTEPPVIAQANPTKEQRARSQYVVADTIDPFGETKVQGKIRTHKVCRRQPVYVTLHNRNGICADTLKVLEWYDRTLGLATKGLTQDSLNRGVGGRGGFTQTEAQINARNELFEARQWIKEGRTTFDAVMHFEQSFETIGGGNSYRADRASKEFKLAANWLLLGIGHRVLPELRA